MLEHIDDSLRRYPRLADQRNADNQCRIATDEVVEELRAKGIRARAIWVRGRISDKHQTHEMGASAVA